MAAGAAWRRARIHKALEDTEQDVTWNRRHIILGAARETLAKCDISVSKSLQGSGPPRPRAGGAPQGACATGAEEARVEAHLASYKPCGPRIPNRHPT